MPTVPRGSKWRRCWFPTICLLIVGLPAQAASEPPPDERAQQTILEGVRKRAQRYQDELPDFICTLLTKRSEDRGGSGKHFKQRDTDEVEFRYIDRTAYRQVLKFNNKRTDFEPLTGFRSDSVLPVVGFLPPWLLGPEAKTSFAWSRWDTIAGRRVAVFTLHLLPADSRLPLANNRESVMAGLHGFMYVDPAAASVLRLELKLELPPGLLAEVAESSFDLDYGPVAIAGQEFFLPVRTAARMRTDFGLLAKNETEVVRYQKYAADSSLTFGDPKR